MSGLREQTAAAIAAHMWYPDGHGCEGCDGATTYDEWTLHVAAAVVEALGLREEVAQYDEPSPSRRWVSGWSVVGETP